MEETNCLMACDANQEHCGAGQASLNRNRSVDAHLSQRQMKASPVPGLRRTTGPSTTREGAVLSGQALACWAPEYQQDYLKIRRLSKLMELPF